MGGAVRGQAAGHQHRTRASRRRCSTRWMRGGPAVPEHLEAPAARPEGPEPDPVRSGAGVLRYRRRSVRAADRGPDRPPPQPHGRKAAHPLDYFQRTIAKAGQRVGGAAAPVAGVAGHAAPGPRRSARATPRPVLLRHRAPLLRRSRSRRPTLPPHPAARNDSGRSKALLCERISAVLGIRIVGS